LNDGSLAVRPSGDSALAPAQYGFGLALAEANGRESIGHGGSINGFNSAITTFPEHKVTIVILTNGSGANRFESAVSRVVLKN
jgi:hypothetical protein